jgi:predicted nucleic acid-binding Zn ribbon protein
MKKPFNGIPDFRPKAERKVEDPILAPRTCMVCHKATQGYGSFQEGYVCSRKCNETYEKNRPSLIDFQIGEHHEKSEVVHRTGSGTGDEPNAGQG